MITKLPSLRITEAHPYLVDYPSIDYTLFNQSLNVTSLATYSDPGIYYNDIPSVYGKSYVFEDNGLGENLIYDRMHNGRYHFKFKGLKCFSGISDLWFMNAVLTGYKSPFENPVFDTDISAVSLQSFANINLAVDAAYLSMASMMPPGRSLNEGMFSSTEVGIRLVFFVDKMDLIDRTVGSATVKNLRFHFTIKAYLIDPSLGGQYTDFTSVSLLGQKSFYYEQTVPTYIRSNFASKNSVKTGWGHFIYPVTTSDSTGITYIQLSDALKTVYNAMVFSQSTDNTSLKADSVSLLSWLDTDTTLRNASDAYQPSSVVPRQMTVPSFGFTESNVLKDWLASISNEATTRGRPLIDFLLSHDNIHWEPLADLYSSDVYSDSPSMFMTRLTTYYEGSGSTPIDQPGVFTNPGGFTKQRRKYFLSNLIQYVASRSSVTLEDVSPYLITQNPEKFMGEKFFPFYRLRQYKDVPSNKELLDLITVPFSSPETIDNIIECETSVDLKKVVAESLNPYRRKIITKPNVLPYSLGFTTTDRINSIGFVEYVNDDSTVDVISLNVQAASSKRNVFSFLTWIFAGPAITADLAQWTREGRYFTNIKDLQTPYSPWKREGLCTIMNSGMYDTPEDAYVEYKREVEKISIYTPPSPSDPAWKDYYKCIPNSETVEETYEYCDPSPSPDGRQVLNRIKKQRVSTSVTGTSVPVGDPTYDYPTTTVILKNQTQVINGTEVLGERTIIYQGCSEFSNRFTPYPTSPTGPVITTGPSGEKKRDVGVAVETFINPAVFKINQIVLTPSPYPIPLMLENAYYRLSFDPDNVGSSSSDYTLRLFPGKRGQVVVLEINTLGRPYKGVQLINGDILANNKTSQRVYISTDVWGDGSGTPVKSSLFLIYDGNDWIEFLRRDIY